MPTIHSSANGQECRLGGGQSYCPLNSIPIDIWEEIFSRCLAPPDDWNASMDRLPFSPQVAPLLLCRICRKWNKVATAQPNLWCYLKVVISLGKMSPPAPAVSQWLDRSGSLPLTLLLSQANGSVANQRAVRDVLEIYRCYIPRWQNIRFELAGLDFGETLAFQQCRAPLLEHLYLKSWPVTRNPERSPLKAMPHLQTLSLSCMLAMDSLQDPDLLGPFSALSSISLDTVVSVSAALQVLGYCQNITRCLLGIEQSWDLPDIPIVQSTLRSLELRIDLESLPYFLDYVTLPALTDLVIHGQRGIWPHSEFNNFLTRSGVHLLSLTLHNMSIMGSQLIALLPDPALRTLVELVIDDDTDWISDPCVTSHTLELLSFDSSTYNGLLPDLKRLKIRLYCFENRRLASMVKSRWRCPQGRRLRSLEVHIYPACPDNDLAQLIEFQKEGLELILLD